MLSFCYQKNPLPINKDLYNYCRKTTENSIRNLTEKYNLERNKPKIKNLLNEDECDKNNKPEFNIYGFLTFLSMTTLAIFFYKRLQ
jgi:hypothetical protein